MAEVSTSIPRELLSEIAQFLRLPECSRLAETAFVLASYIVPHGTRLKDSYTQKTGVVYVKLPVGQGDEQLAVTKQLTEAFERERYNIVDKEGRGMQCVTFKNSAAVRYLLAFDDNRALFNVVTSGIVCAIPVTGELLFSKVAPIIDEVLTQHPTVRRLDIDGISRWISKDYEAGRGVVLAIEDAPHAMAACDLVKENGGFKIRD